MFFHLNLFAQKKAGPNDEEINRAKDLKAIYKDAEIVGLNSLEKYYFNLSVDKDKVTVYESSKERLMCVAPDHETLIVKFYDAESDIKELEVYYKTKKKKDIYVKDEYYNVSDFFYSDARVKYFKLNFPSIGYQYQVNTEKFYKDTKYLSRAFFTTYYPIEKKEIQFVIPRWLNIELKEMNFEGFNIEKTVTYDKDKDADIHTFTARDLKADIKEKNAPGPSHTHPHILILTKSFKNEGKEIALFNSTQDLYNWYRSLVLKVDNDNSVLEEKVKKLTSNAQSDIEKVQNIYYWVQDNIRYIAFEDGIAGFKPDNCQNVFNNKYGDCKGMANLTKEMLHLAGFDARLTWIGTNRIAYDYSTPSLAVDNHMICTVILNGKKYFLDPTEKYNPFNEYAQRIQGKEALIENGETFILEKVPNMQKTNNHEIIHRKLSIKGEQFIGEGTHTFNGESKAGLLYIINNLKTDSKDEAIRYYLNKGDKNHRVSNVVNSDLNNRDQVFTLAYNMELDNAISSFGDQIYIDPDYYKEYKDFKFDQDRKSDYLFQHKTLFEVKTEIELPLGFSAVDGLPQGMKEEHENFSFIVDYQLKDNKIIYHKQISIDHAIVKKKDFELWNNCIQKLNDIYQEQIILEKKS